MGSVISNEDIAVIKTEKHHFDIFTDDSFRNTTLINSPAKINKDILSEFSSKSRPVNLITLNRRKWTTTISNFDNEFIHVLAPKGFEIFIGELVIVEFQTDTNDFIIQTVQHKYVILKSAKNTMEPVLSLKFLDPRMDKRYTVPANTEIYYRKIDPDVCWLTDSKYFMVRKTGYKNGDHRTMIVTDTIGLSNGFNAEGVEDVSYPDKEITELKSNLLKADMENISAGGCSIVAEHKDMKSGSLLFMSIMIDMKGINYKFNTLELLLFAVVRNVKPAEGGICQYGVKFAKRLDNKSLHDFLETWSAQINPPINF